MEEHNREIQDTIESVDTTGQYIRARVQVMDETLPPERSLEVEALVRNVRASMEKAINLGKNISPEVMAIIANLDDAGRLARRRRVAPPRSHLPERRR